MLCPIKFGAGRPPFLILRRIAPVLGQTIRTVLSRKRFASSANEFRKVMIQLLRKHSSPASMTRMQIPNDLHPEAICVSHDPRFLGRKETLETPRRSQTPAPPLPPVSSQVMIVHYDHKFSPSSSFSHLHVPTLMSISLSDPSVKNLAKRKKRRLIVAQNRERSPSTSSSLTKRLAHLFRISCCVNRSQSWPLERTLRADRVHRFAFR